MYGIIMIGDPHSMSAIDVIKRVVIDTTGVCDVTSVMTLRLLQITLIKFAIHRSIFPKRPGRSHWCLYRHQ